MFTTSTPPALRATGYIRLPTLVGEAPVTEAQAEANRADERWVPRRPRPGRPGILPFSESTLRRMVRAGEFPAPVRISDRVSAWRVEDVRAWLESRALPRIAA